MNKRTYVTRLRSGVAIGLAFTLTASIIGCGKKDGSSAGKTGPASQSTERLSSKDHSGIGHSHVAPHGGQIQAVGDHHFELTYEGSTGRFSLYVLGEDESKPAPIGEQQVTLQVRDERADGFSTVTLEADPLEGDSAGTTSRFSASDANLTALGDFTAVARLPIDGQSHRASFQFVGGKPMSTGTLEGFACPMACEKAKVYAEPGKCPVCKMKLEEHKAGATAHADHNPKHGGIFFMAPDNWHHVEGTLVSERELRIYLYDNFTKEIDSAGYSGEISLQPVDDQDEEVGEPVVVPIKPAAGKPYLTAELPETVKPPFQSEARLQFPNAKERFLFNFDFRSVQHKD